MNRAYLSSNLEMLHKAASLINRSSKAPLSDEGLSDLQKRMGTSIEVVPIKKPLNSFYAHKGFVPYFDRMKDAVKHELQWAGIPSHKARQLMENDNSFIAASMQHPEVVAHELGHAQVHERPVVGKLLRIAKAVLPLAGWVGSGAMMANSSKLVRRLAPVASAAGFAPTLVDEGRASLKGYGALKDTGNYSPEELEAMRGNLWRAFGTYAIPPAMAAALTASLPHFLKGRVL